jgi:hypothetical protein
MGGMGGGAGNVAGSAGQADGGVAGGGNGGVAGLSIAGAAGRIQGGAGKGGRGGGDDCETGCVVDDADFCNESEVTWVCEGDHRQDLFRENCEEQNSSGRLRYCCPKSLLIECQ